MAKLKTTDTTVIFGVDGMEYALDIADLTGKEVGVLKRVGMLAGINEIPEAMQSGDAEALAALVGIAMARAGLRPNYERLLNLSISAFSVRLPEDKEVPLAPETSGTPSSPESTG